MITAPFNFVPLSEKVFFPPWAESVSHDIPFEDGESGVIDITITAKSPIFIRDHEKPEEFCQYNGGYYIPSTSIKGMVRSVLEIMSFSKMSIFNDNTYAVRDLSSSNNFYMKEMKKDTFCGWLKKVDNEYIIEDCGIPGRIKHEEIDKALGIKFASKFKDGSFDAKDKEQKTSKYKYALLSNKDLTITLSEKFKSKTNAKYDTREFYNFQQNSNKKAKLVCTGQPTVRKDSGKKGDGKGFEFLFFNQQKDLKVDEKVYKNFLFAYFDKRTTEPKESPDWTYWKEKLESGTKVPVFFQKNGNNIKHLGLSYLYKLPYTNSVGGGVPATHTDCRKDLAETMFGYIDKDRSLKGRVLFSHFKSVNNAIKLNKRTEILGTPRASYYPIYVEQSGNLFTTFMDSNFSIAGRKRYPIHKSNTPNKTEDTGNANVGTTFVPLKEGVIFKGKVRFHNLKKAELGALLSALSFHNTKGCFHNLGMAKSLGYGKVELKIDGIELEEYLKAFESEITAQIPDWINSTQLKELLSMAVEQNNEKNSVLQYMKLEEFAENKTGNKDYLKNYTCLANIKSVSPKSLLSDEEIRKSEDRYKLFKKEQRELIEKREYEERYNQELEVIKQSKNIDKIKSFLKKYPDAKDKTKLEEKISFIEQEEQEDKKHKLADKHKEVNAKAQLAYDTLQKKKGSQKQYKKELEKFVKKWGAEKNNKGSKFVLELVEKAKGNQ